MTIKGDFFMWQIQDVSFPFRFFDGEIYVAVSHPIILENLNEYPFYYCPLDMYGMRESRCSEGYSDEFNTTFQDRCKDDERIQQFFKDALKNPFRADVDFSSMNADVKSKYLN